MSLVSSCHVPSSEEGWTSRCVGSFVCSISPSFCDHVDLHSISFPSPCFWVLLLLGRPLRLFFCCCSEEAHTVNSSLVVTNVATMTDVRGDLQLKIDECRQKNDGVLCTRRPGSCSEIPKITENFKKLSWNAWNSICVEIPWKKWKISWNCEC